jgi:hypothetical protein
MDVEHLWAFVEAIDRTDHDAVGVFTVEAGLGDNVSHDDAPSRFEYPGGKIEENRWC